VLSQTDIKTLLASRGLRPRRALGQNFLVDQNLLRKLLDAADVGEGDLVLEVGPGPGVLTEPMLERGATVVACELDESIAGLCEERLADRFPDRFRLVAGDCLAGKRSLNPDLLAALDEQGADRPFSLVANLPYNAATPLMMTLLTRHPRCASMHVTIQKEVADRLIATPGSKAYGELSVVAAVLAEVSLIAPAGPNCFWPPPKVTSAMLSVVRREAALTTDLERLLRCARELFSHRRKQIGGLIGRDVALPDQISPTLRAEQLSPRRFVTLAETLDRWSEPAHAATDDENEQASASAA